MTQDGGERPVFRRETTTCLMCHESRSVTGGGPGVIMRSVLTDRMGYVVGSVQEGSTTDRTPFEQRLGGWYVTGTHGDPSHAGNTRSPLMSREVSDVPRYLSEFDLNAGGNVTELSDLFDTTPYLSGDSDIVALLVLNHQVRVHNVIRIDAAVDRLLREMLLSREAPLPGPVAGTSSFAQDFVARGPRDEAGRSLREILRATDPEFAARTGE